MDHKSGEDAPPSTDLAGWRRAVGDGCFHAFRMESVVAAIQDLGPTTDKTVMNPLVLHVSDTITRMLRGMIGRNHRSQGLCHIRGFLLASTVFSEKTRLRNSNALASPRHDR